MNKPGVCDFCGIYPAEFTINGGLWWLCRPCMDLEYGGCSCTEDLQLVHTGECKYAPKQCRGISPDCTPDNCKCGEEE